MTDWGWPSDSLAAVPFVRTTVEIYSLRRYDGFMEAIPPPIWIAAAAHHLQLHGRTVDPRELDATAREIMHKPELCRLAPGDAVATWLSPAMDLAYAQRPTL